MSKKKSGGLRVRMDGWFGWCGDKPAAQPGVRLTQIEHFDARGMRSVYGREDDFGRYKRLHLDIWRTRDGRFLMRCWSRCSEIDWRSFEIRGLEASRFPPKGKGTDMNDSWIPMSVRRAYNSWFEEES